MKKMEKRTVPVEIEVPVETDDNGLGMYLGKRVILFCVNYIYSGTLTGVNSDNVILSDGGIVYETGPFNNASFTDFQKVGHEIRVRTSMIESYGPTNKK